MPRELSEAEKAILESTPMRRYQIPFESADQVVLFDDQILIEELPQEAALHKPKQAGKIVTAGRGTARNPKKNLEGAVAFLVRAIGKDVKKVAVGDWVLLRGQAMTLEADVGISVFHIDEGSFAIGKEGSVAAKILPPPTDTSGMS